MTELGKVLKGLECCFDGKCDECPFNDGYYCKMVPKRGVMRVELPYKLAKSAFDMLKAAYPEPHCLTLDELRKVEPETVLWREIYGDKPTVCEFSGTEEFWEINTDIYGKSFRLWTAKPTDEQRKAVKWDDNG